MPQRWRRLHPLLGGLAHACTEYLDKLGTGSAEVAVPKPTPRLSQQHHFTGRKLQMSP
jgi:hypothetical protein